MNFLRGFWVEQKGIFGVLSENYGDGVQVGALARFMLAQDYQSKGETEKAKALFDEIKSKYADALDHSGNLLVNSIQ